MSYCLKYTSVQGCYRSHASPVMQPYNHTQYERLSKEHSANEVMSVHVDSCPSECISSLGERHGGSGEKRCPVTYVGCRKSRIKGLGSSLVIISDLP